ncbi:hypothetical protein HK096_009690, partial [Nowakowskiella sp. JEL0078]
MTKFNEGSFKLRPLSTQRLNIIRFPQLFAKKSRSIEQTKRNQDFYQSPAISVNSASTLPNSASYGEQRNSFGRVDYEFDHIHFASHDFIPTLEDEILLKRGDLLLVEKTYDDG